MPKIEQEYEVGPKPNSTKEQSAIDRLFNKNLIFPQTYLDTQLNRLGLFRVQAFGGKGGNIVLWSPLLVGVLQDSDLDSARQVGWEAEVKKSGLAISHISRSNIYRVDRSRTGMRYVGISGFLTTEDKSGQEDDRDFMEYLAGRQPNIEDESPFAQVPGMFIGRRLVQIALQADESNIVVVDPIKGQLVPRRIDQPLSAEKFMYPSDFKSARPLTDEWLFSKEMGLS
jgi:hypothetical protein